MVSEQGLENAYQTWVRHIRSREKEDGWTPHPEEQLRAAWDRQCCAAYARQQRVRANLQEVLGLPPTDPTPLPPSPLPKLPIIQPRREWPTRQLPPPQVPSRAIPD